MDAAAEFGRNTVSKHQIQRQALNTSDFFGFRFFGFHIEYGLITDEAYSRRQISTGTKFEISYFKIFS